MITPLHIEEDETSIKQFMEKYEISEEEDFNAKGIDKAIKENFDYFELVDERMIENIRKMDEICGVIDE